MVSPEQERKDMSYPHGTIIPSKLGLSKSNPVQENNNKNVGMTRDDGVKLSSSPCTITSHFVWTGVTWVFAYATATQCCDAPPIPSIPPAPGTMISVECEPGSTGEGNDCDCCNVCAGSLIKNGFPICIDGNCILANDYPNGGGPWMPAFNPNGTLVWINAGGL